MGISNKIATKIRTAAKTEIVPLPQPYQDAGYLVAAAVIRAAAATIAQLRLTSTTARGKDFLGIRESNSSYLSTVSVAQRDQDTWSVTLGVLTATGNWAADWQVKITIDDQPNAHQLTLTTPATLTKDGTLVNKSAHAELRDLVRSGMSTGRLPAGTAEVAVSKAALASGDLEPVYASIAAETIETALTVTQARGALDRVPFAVVARQPDGVRWQLDLGGALSRRFASAAITDDGAARTIELRCHPEPDHDPVTSALAARRGIALFDAVDRAVQRLDPGMRRTAEPVSTERPAEADLR